MTYNNGSETTNMKQLIEFIPLIIFFIVYKKVDIFYATGALMIATALAMLVTYLMYKKIEKSAKITAGVVMVVGALTIFFHDAVFIKWKVTIIYGIFALALLGSQWFTDKPLIQRMLGKELTLPPFVWTKLNIAWSLFFIVCALVNVYVAFWLSEDIWINFKVFGLTAATLLFTVLSVVYIYKYMPKEANK